MRLRPGRAPEGRPGFGGSVSSVLAGRPENVGAALAGALPPASRAEGGLCLGAGGAGVVLRLQLPQLLLPLFPRTAPQLFRSAGDLPSPQPVEQHVTEDEDGQRPNSG